MRLIFTGEPSGAFTMRGEQLAATRGHWKAISSPDVADLRGGDAVVVVKSLPARHLEAVRRYGAPIVYDALDFWPRDEATLRFLSEKLSPNDREELDAFTRPLIEPYRPDLILGATEAMTADLSALGWRAATLHHHFDPRLGDAPPRKSGRPVLLYHGHRGFLREWKTIARVFSAVLGVRFATSLTIPPPPADAILAVRGGRHGNPLARRWKSNVKAATAQRLGLPLVAWPEAAYLETAPDAFFFTSSLELLRAIRGALQAERPAPERERFSVGWAAARLERIMQETLP